MQYFTQALGEDDPGRKDLLFDIATEELSHLEIIGSIIAMLNKGPKAVLSEGMEEAMEMRSMTQNSTSHTQQILYGGGPALVNSSGVPWTSAYVDSIGCPTSDLRSNIAAEARAKLVYERLITVTDDPGIVDALRFLMTREVAHQKSFEKALYSIEPNFPRASCRVTRASPTPTTTCRRAKATWWVRGMPASNGTWLQTANCRLQSMAVMARLRLGWTRPRPTHWTRCRCACSPIRSSTA